MALPKEVRQIAKRVRNWGERLQQAVGMNEPSAQFWFEDLGMMCGVCTYKLFKELTAAGYSPVFANSDCHAFILLDGYIVDVTATQFGVTRKVMIRKHKKKEAFEWTVVEAYHNQEHVDLRTRDWPKDQRYVFADKFAKKYKIEY